MRRSPHRAPIQGFTLLELLTAVAIFALVAVMAYGGLRTVLHFEQELRGRAEQLAALQRVWSVLGRDMLQLVDRPIRDEFGTDRGALVGGDSSEIALEFTRGGWRNPTGRARSSLQRVAYRVSNGTLERLTWQVLDRAQDSAPYRAELLSDVRALRLRFLDDSRQWQEQWPPMSVAGAGNPIVAPPLAVEVTLDLEAWGSIRRLFLLPGT